MIIIDIGACVGIFIDDCIEKYGIDNIQNIYAFEPHKTNYDFLVKKYENNDKVKIYQFAVSNFEGEAPFYKKWYRDKDNIKRGYDFAGNAGSSLKNDKSNVSNNIYDTVQVKKISTFVNNEKLDKIDILKIDSEGSEYDILEDIFDNGIHMKILNIYFEDHLRKVKSIRLKKDKIMDLIKTLDIRDKFFVQGTQGDHLAYVPLGENPL